MSEALRTQFDHYLATGETPLGLEGEASMGEAGPAPGPLSLARFHLFDGRGRVKGVYDWEVCRHIKETQEMFVMGGVPYLYEGGCFRPDESGAKVKTLIRGCCYPEFIKAPTIRRIYDLLIGDADLQTTFEAVNRCPAHWINFRNGFYDPIARKMIPHDPAYRVINQIPHAFDPERKPQGQELEAWLRFITPDPEDRRMLLEFAGYCMTRDVSQQKFLILNGEGGTGKSTVIRLIEAMIGSENLASISLSELSQRFAAYGLVGKLLNSCADLELTALEDTSTIKKVLGEDTLRGEAKGKDAFSFKSYARLIFSTNELPIVKSEKSNGFYRRLLILPMNRVPKARRPDLFQALLLEIDDLIALCVRALEEMYLAGGLRESPSSKEAVDQFRMDSDTVAAFLAEETTPDPSARTERGALFTAYKRYCFESDRQALTRNNFYRSMRVKGFRETASMGAWYFSGLNIGKPKKKDPIQAALEKGYVEVDEVLPF